MPIYASISCDLKLPLLRYSILAQELAILPDHLIAKALRCGSAAPGLLSGLD